MQTRSSAFLLILNYDDITTYEYKIGALCSSCMMLRIQIQSHCSMIFPFFIFVLILHVPTRQTEEGSTALPCQSHSNNSAPQELFWIENGTTAVLEPFFLSLFLSSDT